MIGFLTRGIWGNYLQGAALLMGVLSMLSGAGWVLGGLELMLLMLGAGVLMTMLLPRQSMATVMHRYGAETLHESAFPLLDVLVDDLATKAGLSATPRLYRIPCRRCNAFAVGTRRKSAIAITDGMLARLEPEELLAVLAHEISHIKNGDTRLMSLADVLSRMAGAMMGLGAGLLVLNGVLMVMGRNEFPWLVGVILLATPVVLSVMQTIFSRGREYRADRGAAVLTEDPGALASALQKLEIAEVSLIDYWLPGMANGRSPSLLRRHPSNEKRVRRLLVLMAKGMPPSHMLRDGSLYFSGSSKY